MADLEVISKVNKYLCCEGMNMLTKEKLKTLKNVAVVRKFKGKFSIEDMQLFKEYVAGFGFTHDDDSVIRNPKTGGFVFKPSIKRETEGTISVRSKDYIFEFIDDLGLRKKIFGDLSEIKMIENGFSITNYKGEDTVYELK